VDEDAFVRNAERIAEEQGTFTWTSTAATDRPSVRAVELTVGDATLGFVPGEVARIVQDLTR
jgi:hypothetical protein